MRCARQQPETKLQRKLKSTSGTKRVYKGTTSLAAVIAASLLSPWPRAHRRHVAWNVLLRAHLAARETNQQRLSTLQLPEYRGSGQQARPEANSKGLPTLPRQLQPGLARLANTARPVRATACCGPVRKPPVQQLLAPPPQPSLMRVAPFFHRARSSRIVRSRRRPSPMWQATALRSESWWPSGTFVVDFALAPAAELSDRTVRPGLAAPHAVAGPR